MELLDLEQLGKLDDVFAALVIDAERPPGRVLSQIHVGRAVEDHVHAFEQRIFRHFNRIEVDHIAFDDADLRENPVRKLGTAVEFAFVADDLLRPLPGALYGTFAGKADKLAILPFTEQRNDKGAADETGDAGQKNFLHSPWFFRCDPIVQNSKIRLDYTPESV